MSNRERAKPCINFPIRLCLQYDVCGMCKGPPQARYHSGARKWDNSCPRRKLGVDQCQLCGTLNHEERERCSSLLFLRRSPSCSLPSGTRQRAHRASSHRLHRYAETKQHAHTPSYRIFMKASPHLGRNRTFQPGTRRSWPPTTRRLILHKAPEGTPRSRTATWLRSLPRKSRPGKASTGRHGCRTRACRSRQCNPVS